MAQKRLICTVETRSICRRNLIFLLDAGLEDLGALIIAEALRGSQNLEDLNLEGVNFRQCSRES